MLFFLFCIPEMMGKAGQRLYQFLDYINVLLYLKRIYQTKHHLACFRVKWKGPRLIIKCHFYFIFLNVVGSKPATINLKPVVVILLVGFLLRGWWLFSCCDENSTWFVFVRIRRYENPYLLYYFADAICLVYLVFYNLIFFVA